jgi:DNA primase
MAGLIPQSFINDLIDRVDIVDLIDSRVTLKKAGKNYQARCPFHDEKTPSFSVSPDKQFYHCFGCGVSGTALTFLMEYDRLEFVDAVETLARQVGGEVPREGGGRRQKVDQHSKVYAALSAAEAFFRRRLKDSREAVAYLKGRGLTGVVARDFAVGYAPDEWQALGDALGERFSREVLLSAGLTTKNDKGHSYDRFRGRIMFPIRDTRGRVIGFGGRVLGADDGPKYLNSPETPVFHKGRELYGLYEARKALRQIDRLIVVEGYMDVVALAQAGIANSVASLGTATTTDHFHKLFRYADEVVCCFDGDAAGRKAAWRALENALSTLNEGRQLKFMFLPDGEDPDSLVRREGREAFLKRIESASPAIEYLFGRLSEGLDLSQLDGQARLAGLAAPYLKQVPEGILKQLMQRRLEQLTGFAAESAAPRPARAQPGSPPRPPAALTALERRLLRLLLKAPALAAEADAELLDAIAGLTGQRVFAEIVNYLAKNPLADAGDLLGRWAGHAVEPVLKELLQTPLSLDAAALAPEFQEGLARYVDFARGEERRALLDQLRNAPSQETLKELTARRRADAGREARDPGTSRASEASNTS